MDQPDPRMDRFPTYGQVPQLDGYSVVQCITLCYSIIQCVRVCYNVFQFVLLRKCVTVCCSGFTVKKVQEY